MCVGELVLRPPFTDSRVLSIKDDGDCDNEHNVDIILIRMVIIVLVVVVEAIAVVVIMIRMLMIIVMKMYDDTHNKDNNDNCKSNGSDDDGLKAIDNKIDKPENSIT